MQRRSRSVPTTTAALPAVLFSVLCSTAAAQGVAERGRAPAVEVAKVTSADGTAIAYEKSGRGPVLILVASALSDRGDAARLASLLAPAFTVLNYDRRGRGESGDTSPYAVQREIEDIDALIEAAGGSAFLFGSSSGAVLALEAAAALTSKVKAVALFEPPFLVDDSREPIPEALFTEIDSLLAEGRRGDAVALFMSKAVGVPEPMVAQMKRAPMWRAMERRAHTLPYDGAIMKGLQAGQPLPQKRWSSVTARTLVIDGEQSPPFLRSAVRALVEQLPSAKRHTLKGHDHSAVYLAPGSLVPVLRAFFADPRPGAAAK